MKVWLVERIATDGWSCTGVSRRSLCAIFQTEGEAEKYVREQPKDDGDGSGMYQWSYSYRIKGMAMGVDLKDDEEEG
jgi:hypothetical protein